ncbi:hypothetical protein I3760_06G134100 [Carya illinoinensis]|nr:hypothetical protein I3760_06G134100 [Carya illinoinensis]
MASQQQFSALKGKKVLMVGAGGIGCELLKTLALSGFQDIHIIDMDTIEVSNLNRQFLFRQSHVGQSKAKVAREAVLKFRPHIKITPYHANVKDPDFNVDFFKQFNVVLNGLDNLDARRHVNRLCLAAEVPLVESGTTGFLGQVTVHVKGRTECYECQPKPAPKTYPVCTITSTPSKDIWSLMENSRIFLEAFKLFFMKREKEIGNLTFDKDDQLAVEFVTAAANIRASSFDIPLKSLFEAKGIAGNIVHAVATTNAIIAGLIVTEAIKVLQSDTKNYRMTYCLEHPTRKMLLMPVEPFEANKSCYVCSETPLKLEINTRRAKLRDFVEKIVKAKLGMYFPLIMHGSALLYEVGDDLDEDMVANYAANLEKVLSELPSPITSGITVTVEDMKQELTCNINIKHREEFDEEKEPDGMLLSGWTRASSVEKDDNKPIGNGGSTSNASVEVEKNDEIRTVPSGKKRKVREVPMAAAQDFSNAADGTRNHNELEVIVDEDDFLMLGQDPGINKKKRLQ